MRWNIILTNHELLQVVICIQGSWHSQYIRNYIPSLSRNGLCICFFCQHNHRRLLHVLWRSYTSADAKLCPIYILRTSIRYHLLWDSIMLMASYLIVQLFCLRFTFLMYLCIHIDIDLKGHLIYLTCKIQKWLNGSSYLKTKWKHGAVSIIFDINDIFMGNKTEQALYK
jgi:hypothetical protein